MPVVDKVAGYMLSLGLEDDGILRVPGASGTGIDSTKIICNASNWYDVVCFGHADGALHAGAESRMGCLIFGGKDGDGERRHAT